MVWYTYIHVFHLIDPEILVALDMKHVIWIYDKCQSPVDKYTSETRMEIYISKNDSKFTFVFLQLQILKMQ